MNLVTANGVPAFAAEFNTPLHPLEIVRSFFTRLADHVSVLK